MTETGWRRGQRVAGWLLSGRIRRRSRARTLGTSEKTTPTTACAAHAVIQVGILGVVTFLEPGADYSDDGESDKDDDNHRDPAAVS